MTARVRLPELDGLELVLDPQQLARQARLRYINDSMPGFKRRRCGKGFLYLDEHGLRLEHEEHLTRIASLVIPPAWQDVWICPLANGHLQATGRDDRGRKQYIYHQRWSQMASWVKFRQLRAFGRALPRLRRRVRRDLSSPDDRTRVLALMVLLLDKTAMRVGNRDYAEENESYGLTTLLDEHVTVDGDVVVFEFLGKSGQEHRVELRDRTIASRIQALLGRKGMRLFETRTQDGSFSPLEAEHVNEYLRVMTPPGCTAKTFRTWHGTVAAFEVLVAACECQAAAYRKAAAKLNGGSPRSTGLTKRAIEQTLRESIKAAAELLGNTTTVCKAYYVHPALCDLYAEASLATHLQRLRPKRLVGLKQSEQRLLALLDRIDRLRD